VSGPDLDARPRSLAPIVAAGLVAQTVASSAARDALFLTHFPVTTLPYFVAGAALLSLPAAQLSGRMLARLGPGRLVPWLLGASGVLFLVEWALLDPLPRLAAALLYIHGAVLAGIAISAFWSLLNERFDPHSAKALLARVAGAATFGGLVGGVGAERVAALLSPRALLAVLGLIGFVAAIGSSAVAQGAPPRRQPPADPKHAAPWTQIRRSPYLRHLALVVLLAAAVAGLVDYALKVEAVAHFPKGQPLVRFFGLFYAGTGLLAFVIQSTLGKTALARLGLAGCVAAHPAAVAIASALGFVVPGPWRGVLPRGTDVCVRNSVFRAGYELLYTPLPEATKRSAKPIIDVGWDSVGKGAGAAVVLALTRVPAAWAFAAVNAAALVAAALEFGVARRLRSGYVQALQGGLLRGSECLEEAAEYSLSDFTMVESMARLDRAGIRRALGTVGAAAAEATLSSPTDPVVAAIADLRSGDPWRLRASLRALPRDPLVVGALVPLLDRRDVLREVVAALESFGARASAQLVDTLLDPDAPDAVRRRIPAVLRSCASPVARDGLVAGLRLCGFELRLRCGRALLALTERHPELVVPGEAALRAVDLALGEGGEPGRLREHLLNLLILGLEREPASIAARALDTDDAHLRGTALEYFETVLPPGLFAVLEPRLTAARVVAARPAAKPRSALEMRDELAKVGATMTMSLEEVRRQLATANAAAKEEES
jgi:hypothetical protein